MTLKSFPRGGRKPQVKTSTDLLFDNKKTVKKHKKKSADDKSKGETALVATTAERLSYTTLREGLIILGRIYDVTEYDVIITLPGGMKGRLQVTNLCETYTNLLQNIIKSENNQPDEFKPLPEMYSAGEYVVCYVKAVKLDEKWKVDLSLEPQLINQFMDNSRLVKDSPMVCSISSIEDHGYVVDTGIANVRAFIAKKDIDNEKQYFPGKQVFCCIKKITTAENISTVKLTAKQKKVENVLTNDIQFIDGLIPGSKIELRVERILSNGLQVSFGGNNVGYINQIYLDNPRSSYVKDMELIGTLLYVMPTVKFAYFSLLIGKTEKKSLNVGDIVSNASVLYREGNDIILQLPNGARGLIPLQKTQVDYSEVSQKFTPGSAHKCRILAYNVMERIYICTAERDLLEQRYFTCDNFNPGDIVKVEVTNIKPQSGLVIVQAGRTIGFVDRQFVSDKDGEAVNKIKVGDKLEARVLYIEKEKNKVHFTLNQTLVKSKLPVLHNINDAKRGSKHHGTVVLVNKNGLLVRLFGTVKGWLPPAALGDWQTQPQFNYSVGQIVAVKIAAVNKEEGKLTLSLAKQTVVERKIRLPIGTTVTGTVIDSSAEGVTLKIDSNDKDEQGTAFLPAGHMAPSADVASLLASKCVPGDSLSASVFATSPDLLLCKTFLPAEKCHKLRTLKIGDCIPCSVKEITEDGLTVVLPLSNYTKHEFIPSSKVTNFGLVRLNQVLFAKVTYVNEKQRQLCLTMELEKIWVETGEQKSKMMSAVDILSLHFNTLSELRKTNYYKTRPISSVKLGTKVTAEIEKITSDGLVLKLENGLRGIVRKGHYNQSYKAGEKVTGSVMWINYVHELVDVTLLPKLMNDINAHQSELPNLPFGVQLRGQIIMITDWFILVVIKGQGHGCLIALPARRHVNDLQPNLKPYTMWSKVRCYVILNKKESEIVPICMLKSVFELPKPSPQANTSLTEKKDLKRKNEIEEKNDQVELPKKVKTDVDVPERVEQNKKTKKEKESAKDQQIMTPKKLKTKGDKNDGESTELSKKSATMNTEKPQVAEESSKRKKKKELKAKTAEDKSVKDEESKETLRLPECGFLWDNKTVEDNVESSSDSDEENEEQPKTKKKKLSAAERREAERQKEREIRQREEALASNDMPNSVDQFDRLVLSSPDSSLVWLQYMAYHLQATEIEKARAVARKAIKTINFREENERLNVWNAWLNLESKFGTLESLNDVFQEAVKTNDPLKVYTHMLAVHVDAGRQVELEKTIGTMIGKFKQDPQVWIECGNAYLKIGLKDKSRHTMQRALQSLPPSHHVNLMVRFAHLENKLGDKERAQTLFEQILSSYPKRVDVWTSYVDALVKSEDYEMARKVLERATVQTLPPRKMKTLFKKFMTFEEQHGTPEGVARVQQMAAEYVENQCNKLSSET